ncbi:MAG: hypothetical protein ACK4PR_03615 [Gammaproteobacteria bacterium]
MIAVLRNPYLHYDYELYRGSRNNAIKYLYAREENREKLKEVPLIFKNKNSPHDAIINNTLNQIKQQLNYYQKDTDKLSDICHKLIKELESLQVRDKVFS